MLHNVISRKKLCKIRSNRKSVPKTHSKVGIYSTNGVGTDVTITINLEKKYKVLVDYGLKRRYTIAKNYMILGHELIHADRNMKGIAYSNDKFEWYSYYDVDGSLKWDLKRTEELMVMGIIGGSIFSENGLRREHGLPIRIKY